jgi:hypothetical protein
MASAQKDLVRLNYSWQGMALYDHHQIDAAIIDFTKAFDKVPHEKLFSNLEF